MLRKSNEREKTESGIDYHYHRAYIVSVSERQTRNETTNGREAMAKTTEISGVEVDWNNGALSTLRMDEGWTIVRKTRDGQFAVIRVIGLTRRVVKVLPTFDRARAYNFALAGEKF